MMLPQAEGTATIDAHVPSLAAVPSEDLQPVVLLVDDQEAVVSAVSRLLERSGFRVRTAASMDEARAIGKATPGGIDVLLSDVVMPDANGPDLAAELFDAQPQMKILWMSGYAEIDLIQDDVLRGDVAFIRKPFSGNELAEKIRSLLREGAAKRAR